MTKTIGDLQAEAVHIEALCQGAEVLHEHIGGAGRGAPPDVRAASNALSALLPTIVARVAALAAALDDVTQDEHRVQYKD